MCETRDKTSVIGFLRGCRVNQADWIHLTPDFNKDTIEKFFSSRVVYYPGSGTDGRAIAIFNSTKSAYCFVHVDLKTSAKQVIQELSSDNSHRCDGYSPTYHEEIPPVEFQEILNLDMTHPSNGQNPNLKSVLWTVLRREPGKSSNHGFDYLAFLHIQAEAVWACGNLWKTSKINPFGLILQDHGFGGNNARFGGRDAPLYRVAEQTKHPDYLLVAKGTREWPHYQAVSEWSHRVEGNQNRLFHRME
ncbi:hypothetical protein Enr10x_52640 [Gimesia panareensis]|uniref:Uncharacterized protein n=1 Tax=Gimesia panareensis TaxID=2527978 RepID=A0A517QE99_9PLAN|nr:hypothetical protein [Gimesia panareensis]QDT29907.1 hypothetical protein Enr10x_52640 [Gimesia panareensis]